MSNSTIFFLVTVFIVGSECQVGGQEYEKTRMRCEEILFSGATSEGRNYPGLQYYLSKKHKFVSLEKIGPILLGALKDGSVAQQVVAAELLYEKTGRVSRDQILKSLESIQIKDGAHFGDLYVRIATLRWKLGEKRGYKDLIKLAADPYHTIWPGGWVCPAIHVAPVEESGVCPVCGGNLEKAIRNPNVSEWKAKLLALEILQEHGEAVGEFAKAVVASDARALFRMQAAAMWAKEEPELALPHLKVFLNREGGHYDWPEPLRAELFLFEHDPKMYRPTLLQLVKDKDVRASEAVELLYQAGSLGVLEPFRTIVKGQDETVRNLPQAVFLLGGWAGPRTLSYLNRC